MIRLFVALLIPNEVKTEIFKHSHAVAENQSDCRWEASEKVHLTLKFIGEINEELLQQIIDQLEFLTKYSSFNCKISKFGFFFRDREPKILWCNLETDDSLVSLVDDLNNYLQKYGIEVEKRKFKGHLTLLRIKKRVNEQFIKNYKEFKFDPIKFNSNQIALIQSVLKTNRI